MTVIKLQYDAVASFPDRPWHLLSVLNAVAGGIYYHGPEHYSQAAQDVMNGRVPPEYISTTVNSQGGVTTTYTVQQDPAFLHPLEPVFPHTVAAVNKVLTPIIDLGYSERTPDAGPHLAPGGQLVDKFGKPVFPLSATQSSVGSARTALSAAAAADTAPVHTAPVHTAPARGSAAKNSAPADREPSARAARTRASR